MTSNIASRSFHVTASLVLACVGMLVGCSGPERIKPAELGNNPARIGVRAVWSSGVGPIQFPMGMRSIGNSIFAAGSSGIVAEIDARTGGDVWRLALGLPLAAGVGSDGRYVAVVSRTNEAIAIESGREIWRQKLNAVSMTAPLVAGARVFTLTADRSVSAFDAATGRKLWQQKRAGEALVLGQAGIIMAIGDTLVVGLGGRLVGLNPQSGATRWDTALASSRGTNDVERLVDLVSGVSRVGDEVCVRAFQSMVGCFDGSKGTLLWSKVAMGSTGLGGDAAAVFGTESDGKVIAWRRLDGERLWSADQLKYRALTAPQLVGRSVVVGDDSGFVHFLSRDDGSLLTRVPTDGSPVVGVPVLMGQTLIAATQRGGLFAFRPE